MPIVHDRCICVGKTEYSETSQILSLLGRGSGLIRVIAKGAHRRTKAGSSKFDGGVDLLDVGEAVAIIDPARDLGTLTEWALRQGHLKVRSNLRGIYLGLYAAELVATFLEEHDPHPELFDQFETVLDELSGPRLEESFLFFQVELLRQLGHAPHLESCVQCGAGFTDREAVYFSPANGGVICRNCEGTTPDRISIDPRLLRLAARLGAVKSNGTALPRLPSLTRHQTDPLNRLLAAHMQHIAGKRLKMPPYIMAR